MERHVLIVPLEEVVAQLTSNERQDVKIVAPEILSQQLFELLASKGRAVKKETKLEGEYWQHSENHQPNLVAESGSFPAASGSKGQFALAFANEQADQESHYHPNHSELYFSEHALEARYRLIGQNEVKEVRLAQGGLIVFSPGVVHKVRFHGLTLIVEFPAVPGDKIIEEM